MFHFKLNRQYRADELRVVMGTLNLDTITNETIIASITEVHVHSGYNALTLENDIAMMFLNVSVPNFTIRKNNDEPNDNSNTESQAIAGKIAPIKMTSKVIPVDSVCQVSGWGVTRIVS